MKNLINKNLLNTLIFLLLTLLLLSNCCEEITEPKPTEPDTTTQDFVFEEYLFGDGYSSSYLNGVWIFSENNIWAVGWLHGLTNIIRWNGTNWYDEKSFQGTSSGIYDIWALDSNTVYFVTGGIYKYKNGTYTRQVITNLPPQGMILTDIWASSENNVWAVGEWGAIAHYDGVSWKKVEFDTQWRFCGITGNKETGIAFAVAINSNFTCIITQLEGSNVSIIYDSNDFPKHLISYDISMIGESLILSDYDIWKFNITTKNDEILLDLPTGYYLPVISSNSSKDIYFWGNKLNEGQKMIHFNGIRFREFQLPSRNSVIYGGAHTNGNLTALAAFADNKAYLIMIRRTK